MMDSVHILCTVCAAWQSCTVNVRYYNCSPRLWELTREFIDVSPHDICDYHQSVLENSDQLFNFSQRSFWLRLLTIKIVNSHCKDLPMLKFLHRVVCLFTPQLLVVLILPTQVGWPGGVNPVSDQIQRRCERDLYLCFT